MLIVGELINTSRKAIKPAVESRDAAFIKDMAQRQVDAGADYVDVNCGTMVFNEEETMAWLVETVQSQVSAPLCLDSPNAKALEMGLSLVKNGQPMINSITAEKERFATILPFVLKYKAKIVGLCMDDSGMPETAADRLKIADKLVGDMVTAGVPEDDIYLDPLVKPVSTGDKAGLEVLETIYSIKQKYPKVHGICGLSNISYGLPNRKILNQVFMIQTMTMGMDGYILDPLDKTMMGFVYASQALLGKDEFCMKYLTAHRNGLYE
ncbi:methyltetrahydrofolate cobalamin methyltransferase [Candidatus Formimonas warabiya]|uniref:Methyltetrahydrofolate--corrinoid methyltransferase n=1 Tax=Formimonas warabiya TaxID=1761012 RepID=A0A3G1KQI0_FORW1|nr:methyltetrahydrofolate cobalamin methyltransferase [Candidatus Formimonas warabiya]ATW24706.1 methyltetrahydrofolate--corrinoid methyltransferase [Candidatus Formimonas warabiya]